MWVAVVNGFLGAGKTTFVRHLLEQAGSGQRIAVLVNEFGEVGIDGSLIQQYGAGVVELTNGCICCNLTPELRKQVLEIKQRYKPELLLIEPTGAATVGNVLQVLQAPGMEEHLRGLSVVLLIDAARFLDHYRANRLFVEGQIRSAGLVIINKCDKVDYLTALLIRDTVAACNPAAATVLTRYGRISRADWEGIYQRGTPPGPPADLARAREHLEEDYDSFSWCFNSSVEASDLRAFVEGMVAGTYGEVVRAKGLVETREGWLRFDYVPYETFWEIIPEPSGGSRLVIIGRGLNHEYLRASLGQLS